MTREEYLIELARVIKETFEPSAVDGSMTAAKAGFLARHLLGEEPRAYGFYNFKEALLELERRGVIRTGVTPKDALAIWLADAASTGDHRAPITSLAVQKAEPLPSTLRFHRLRNPIWLAFVSRAPTRHSFMHRETGQVLTGGAIAPEPTENWVEIESIDDASEKTDAIAFAASESLAEDESLKGALASANWFREFPRLLRERDPFLASKWNRRRSNRVIAKVTQWCLANGISAHLVFEPGEQPLTAPAHAPSTAREQLKPLLLSAVHLMSTKELLSLPRGCPVDS